MAKGVEPRQGLGGSLGVNRQETLFRVEEAPTRWDILVIGGGATGLGTAADAASRGYRTLLVERADFAKGTSSRSTKLIHGGFRYLKQGNIRLVRESLRERGRLLRNAPHLVRPLPFILPLYHLWERPYYEMGLRLYDGLAGSLGLEPCRPCNRDTTLDLVPNLQPAGLRGSLRYLDAQFDDARLAMALLRTIEDHEGAAINYMTVVQLLKRNGRVCGALTRDEESGRECAVTARAVINATGIFTDAIRRLDEPQSPALMTVSQGAHLVLDQRFLSGSHALMVPRTHDGRVLFAIPWHDKLLLGTTDTPVDQAQLEPRPLPGEIDFLLDHARAYLAKAPSPSDILSVFAGLRPLVRSKPGAATSRLARNHALFVSSSGLVTITGGKWTTYRQMAEEAVDRAAAIANLPRLPCRTADLALHGCAAPDSPSRFAPYGTDQSALETLVAKNPVLGKPLHPRLPYRQVEIVWAARHEMARTVEDVLARRTRALYLDAEAAMESAPLAASLLAGELDQTARWQQDQVNAFLKLAETHRVGSPTSFLDQEASC